jgi:hypothetical protein
MKHLKYKAIVGIAVTVALLLVVSTALADLPGGGWWTAEQIQNVDPGQGQAHVQLMAYDSDSATYDCGEIDLDYGEGHVWVPTDAWGITPNCGNLPSGFEGSAVVTADKPIVAIVQETNREAAPLGTPGGKAVAAYRGTDALKTATKLLFPQFKNNHGGETTTFYIQNAGSANTSITATFITQADAPDGGKVEYTHAVTGVEPNRMVVIVPGDAGVPSGDGYYGGLTVTSDGGQALAGVVNEHATTATGAATHLKSVGAFTPTDADNTVYAPSVKKLFPLGAGASEKWSALIIQNAEETGTVDMDITYTVASQSGSGTPGATYVDDTSCTGIEPGESCFVLTLYPVAGSGTASLLNDMLVSAKIEATGNVVALVNEATNVTYGGTKQYATYSAIPDSAKSNKVSVPGYKEHWQGRYHGVVVMNVGPSAANYTVTIDNVNYTTSPPSAPLVASTSGVAANQANTFLLLSVDLGYSNATLVSGTPSQFDQTNNSMVVESNQPVVVLANEGDTWMSAYGPPGLDASNYEGFPIQ